MAIKIEVSDTVGIPVKGTINDAAGIAQPFSFKLVCKRLGVDEFQATLKDRGDSPIVDFLAEVTTDWHDVRDDDNKQLPYSSDALRKLCKIPGVAGVAFRSYQIEVGAKEKN